MKHLLSIWGPSADADIPTVLGRLGAAVACGLIVAAIHRGTRAQHRLAGSFPGTLVMLCVLIAMVTQVVGDNVALAFSLVGALSIVRFRTVVHDTRDTAFVIFAVAVGMALGAGQPIVAAGGVVTTGVVAWLFRDRPVQAPGSDRQDFELVLLLDAASAGNAEPRIREVLERHPGIVEQTGCATVKKGASLEVVYRLQLPIAVSPQAFVAALCGVDGVQGVNLRRAGENG